MVHGGSKETKKIKAVDGIRMAGILTLFPYFLVVEGSYTKHANRNVFRVYGAVRRCKSDEDPSQR